MNIAIIILAVVLLIFILLCVTSINNFNKYPIKKEKFVDPTSPRQADPVNPYYFAGLPPTTTLEKKYRNCILNACGGNIEDKVCLQTCYIQSMKDGCPEDYADRVCFGRGNEIECQDAVYGTYHWMDRFVGESCPCPNNRTGYQMKNNDGSMHCMCRPDFYPLQNRIPCDSNGDMCAFKYNPDEYSSPN